jgi:hypothetical protein
MPLIEREDKREQEPLRIRLQPGVAEQHKEYCKFADSSEAHIVNAALQRLFVADREFKEFLDRPAEAHKPEAVAASLASGKRGRNKKQSEGEHLTEQTGESTFTAA